MSIRIKYGSFYLYGREWQFLSHLFEVDPKSRPRNEERRKILFSLNRRPNIEGTEKEINTGMIYFLSSPRHNDVES